MPVGPTDNELYLDRIYRAEHEAERLRREVERLRAKTEAGENLAGAVAAYFNKRGVAHAERKGNEDIAAMADALSDYGYAINLADAPPAGG